MYSCILWFDLFLVEQPNSLKGKRSIIKSIKERIRNKFGVSAAEVGNRDLWQRTELGVAFVSSERKESELMAEKLIHSIDGNPDVEITDHFIEITKFK